MKEKNKNIIVIIVTIILIYGLSFLNLIKKDDDYSSSERRVLAARPKLSYDALSSGKYMEEFENYCLDQFPMRDDLRSIKSGASQYLLGQLDYNGIYNHKGYLSKLEYPLNEDKVSLNISAIDKVYDRYIKDSNCNIYLSLIPDKNYYLTKNSIYPSIDYDSMLLTIQNNLSYASYIDIEDLLSYKDFYITDQHWRQDRIIDIANRIADRMGVSFSDKFELTKLNNPFYGTYYRQYALKHKSDTITYLSNDAISSCIVTSYNSGRPKEAYVYDMNKADSPDPYEMFLSGSDALLVIENPLAENDKELIVFRDSFGSSLIPLLIQSYSKITVIDLRYITIDSLSYFVTFDNQDVLFLYSTLIFNNSISRQ